MADALFFDAYGTILEDIKYTIVEVSETIVSEYDLDMTGSEFFKEWSRRFWGILEDDFHTIKEANEISLGMMFKECKIKSDPAEYIESLHQRWFYSDVYPEVKGILETLNGIPRCIVSNADDDFLLACLESNGLVFDGVITSESTRSYKPDRRIFRAALRKMGCKARNCIHLGNSLERDVAGAVNSGIPAIWVNREKEVLNPQSPRPWLEVQDLRGLPSLLELRKPSLEQGKHS